MKELSLTILLLIVSGTSSQVAAFAQHSIDTNRLEARASVCIGMKDLGEVPEDCICKGVLDDMVAPLFDSREPYVIVLDAVGYADERPRVELERVDWARGYLVNEKGIDPNRVVMRWTRRSTPFGTPSGWTIHVSLVPRNAEFPAAIPSVSQVLRWPRQTASN